MKAIEYSSERFEYYRNNEFSGIENANAMEDVATPQPRGNVEVKATGKDPVNQEREQQLEAWMSDIKAFIRNIDTSKL
jgi:hypothetical protein